jgi:prepilin-type N-terminal cleavage/methylation domain-containing protein
MKTHTGFTLIELICVIVMVSIGLVGMARLLQATRLGPLSGAAVQNATQLAQDCADLVLNSRRSGTYGTQTATMCDNLITSAASAGYSGYTNYALSLSSSSTATSACPTGAACTYWTVKVTPPADLKLQPTMAAFMLVQY